MITLSTNDVNRMQGRIQDFKLGGALKKLRRTEGGAKIVGVFRVENHDFTPKNHIFSNFRGVRPRAGGAPGMHTRVSGFLFNKVII
jgi:hypothetical protein